jgi:hypothetical protein
MIFNSGISSDESFYEEGEVVESAAHEKHFFLSPKHVSMISFRDEENSLKSKGVNFDFWGYKKSEIFSSMLLWGAVTFGFFFAVFLTFLLPGIANIIIFPIIFSIGLPISAMSIFFVTFLLGMATEGLIFCVYSSVKMLVFKTSSHAEASDKMMEAMKALKSLKEAIKSIGSHEEKEVSRRFTAILDAFAELDSLPCMQFTLIKFSHCKDLSLKEKINNYSPIIRDIKHLMNTIECAYKCENKNLCMCLQCYYEFIFDVCQTPVLADSHQFDGDVKTRDIDNGFRDVFRLDDENIGKKRGELLQMLNEKGVSLGKYFLSLLNSGGDMTSRTDMRKKCSCLFAPIDPLFDAEYCGFQDESTLKDYGKHMMEVAKNESLLYRIAAYLSLWNSRAVATSGLRSPLESLWHALNAGKSTENDMNAEIKACLGKIGEFLNSQAQVGNVSISPLKVDVEIVREINKEKVKKKIIELYIICEQDCIGASLIANFHVKFGELVSLLVEH